MPQTAEKFATLIWSLSEKREIWKAILDARVGRPQHMGAERTRLEQGVDFQ